MKKRGILTVLRAGVLFGAFALLAHPARAAATAEAPPNVILILADDLALGDLAALNGGRTRTPHLDRLIASGVWFDRATSASAVCAPARAALLTGRYPHRTGVVSLDMRAEPQLTRLRRDETTLADLFAARGYRTGLVGKWHLGLGAEWHPRARGFAEFAGFIGDDQIKSYDDYTLEIDGAPRRVTDRYLTDELTDRAIGFVHRHRAAPFFLHLAHFAPHRPLGAPADLVKSYTDRGLPGNTATVHAMVEVLDRGVGALMAALDELGLRERTLVVFASDNGPDPLAGPRFNHGLRGAKYDVFEGGLRVPLLFSWPGTLAAARSEFPAHFTDLLPTLADLCALARPALPLDGVSFAAHLRGAPAPAAPLRAWQWNRGAPNYTHNLAVREGDWKLVRPPQTRNRIAGDSAAPPALYNLSADPAEARDVAAQNPAVAARLRAAAEAWSASVEADRTRAPRSSAARPNIVFILADDLGWRDLRCTGSPWHDTPHLDRLAREGTRFTQGYAAAPICSASRAALLTGRSPARLGFEFVTKLPTAARPAGHALLGPPYPLNLPLSEVTLGEMLGTAGYATGYFGKWHVSEHTGGYLGWSATHGPLQQGYAEGDADFGNHPYAYRERPALKSEPLALGDYGRDPLTEKAVAFLRARRAGPFFLHLAHYFVHDPIHTRAAWLVEKYRARLPAGTEPRRVEFAAMVETLDHYVGQVLAALDELGLREETLVVFTSDNGGHPEFSANGPLRGGKWNLHEAGVRVPWVVRWPGRIAAGAAIDAPFIGTDLLPTFAAATGAALPAGVTLDGRDALPLWRGDDAAATAARERVFTWHFPYYHPETGYAKAKPAIGVDDFAVSQTRPHSALRRGDWKLLHFHEDDRVELYDLAADPGEQRDLAAREPARARELRARLAAELREQGARFATRAP